MTFSVKLRHIPCGERQVALELEAKGVMPVQALDGQRAIVWWWRIRVEDRDAWREYERAIKSYYELYRVWSAGDPEPPSQPWYREGYAILPLPAAYAGRAERLTKILAEQLEGHGCAGVERGLKTLQISDARAA